MFSFVSIIAVDIDDASSYSGSEPNHAIGPAQRL